MYQQETPPAALAAKLHALLTTPFVSNAATEAGRKPLKPSTSGMGPFLRVVQWNIERGLEFDAVRLREIRHPVIVAGDTNTSDQDGTPITVGRLFRRRFGSAKWWASEGVKEAVTYTTPFGLLYQSTVATTGFARKLEDPTGRSIPIIGRNSEAKMFDLVEQFRFDDGTTFDVRGDRGRTANGHGGRLADSNERGLKGFEPTEELNRHYGPVGKYKLDWFFVKPAGLQRPDDSNGPLRFAPHSARTLQTLNHALPDRISDHNPIVVDLPLGEPQPQASRSQPH